MKILAFETLSNGVSTALMVNGKITSLNISTENSQQSEILVSEIEKTLRQNNLDYFDLDLIATSNGPASFTGTRIALSCARTIRIATNIPLILLNSCEIIAHQYRNYCGEIFAIIQANPDEFFYSINEAPPKLTTKEDLINLLPRNKFLLCGSGKEFVAQITQNKNFEISPQKDEIRADLIATLAAYKIKDATSAQQNFEPIYLRSPNITKRKK